VVLLNGRRLSHLQDPYFPKGNVSLQYASSCDAIDEHRFKLRTSERNYTFTADSEKSRDEWIKAIQKVMFKTQHEGESVKVSWIFVKECKH